MAVGTYLDYPALGPLAPLVQRQRQLEAQIVPLAALTVDEKAIRAQIDALLIAAGVEKVTCNGYDVAHVERAGSQRLNQDVLTEQLIGAGFERARVVSLLADCTETGEPSSWATVKPSKGAKVRRP